METAVWRAVIAAENTQVIPCRVTRQPHTGLAQALQDSGGDTRILRAEWQRRRRRGGIQNFVQKGSERAVGGIGVADPPAPHNSTHGGVCEGAIRPVGK